MKLKLWLSIVLLAVLIGCRQDTATAPSVQLSDASLTAAPLIKLTAPDSELQGFRAGTVNLALGDTALPARLERTDTPTTRAASGLSEEEIDTLGLELPNDEDGHLAFAQAKDSVYRIVRVNMATLEKEVLFEGASAVQSVAITADGNFVLFAAALGDNNEVFAYDLSGDILGEAGTLLRFTNTPASERDVSLALGIRPVGLFADNLPLAWQGTVEDETSGETVDTIVLAELDPAAGTLSGTPILLRGEGDAPFALLEPSMSGDGENIVSIIDLGVKVVLNIDFAAGSPVLLLDAPEGTSLSSPSLDYSGTAFTVLASSGSGATGVALYFEAASDDVFILNGAADEHPFLTATGDAYAYGYARNIFTSPLGSDPDRRISDEDGFADYGAYWSKAPVSTALIEYGGTNDQGPFVRLPEDDLSDEERTVFYDARTISVAETGFYAIRSEQSYDGYLNLYRAPFDPAQPANNLLASNDDLGSQVSSITFELEAGTDYVVVTSACGVTDFCGPAQGNFLNSVSPTDAPPPTFNLPAPDNSGYNITLRFADEEVTNSLTDAQKEVFVSAAARWSSVITGDVANIENFSLPALFSVPGTGAVEGTLDDVLIDVKFSDLDGPGGLLGQAGPRITRKPGDPDENLSVYGTMEFDIAEFGEGGFFDNPQQYSDVIVHEMAHVLGIGTLWEPVGLTEGTLQDPPRVAPGLPNPDYDPRFTGTGAVAEYQKFLTAAGRDSEASVPIANTGGPGNFNGHWRELVFDNELMTPYAGGTEILSRMTAASLGDVGYTVNVDAADGNYTLPVPSELVLLSPTNKTYTEFVDYLVAAASPDLAVTGTVAAVDLALTGERASTSGCEAADFSGFPEGAIALVQRGACSFADKVANAEAAGAVATVIFNQGNVSDTPEEDDRFGPVGIALGSYEPTGAVIGASFELGEELAGYDEATLRVNTGIVTGALEAQAVNGGIATDLRLDFREVLLRPTATVSSSGTIKPID